MRVRGIVLAAALASSVVCPLRVHALDAPTPIVKVCPGIDPAIVRLGVGSLLPSAWDKRASPERCADLNALAERYTGKPASTLPAVSNLRAIALRLQQPQASTSSSLWTRIKDWLRHRLAPLAGVVKWMHSLPTGNTAPGAQALLLVGAGVLILLGIAAIILRELRLAGLFDRARRRRAERRPAAQTRVGTAEGSVDDDIDRALEHPASALRVLIEALRRSRRIERDGSLTSREVLAHAVFDTQGQRAGFANIALLAERELFGPRGSPIRVPDELRPTLQALYTQLLAAPATRPAVS